MAKILFLAQFAPTNGKKVIPLSSEEKFYAETYHLPICDILEKYGYDYVTSSDVKELIQNYAQYDLVWSVYNRLGFRNCEVFVPVSYTHLDVYKRQGQLDDPSW